MFTLRAKKINLAISFLFAVHVAPPFQKYQFRLRLAIIFGFTPWSKSPSKRVCSTLLPVINRHGGFVALVVNEPGIHRNLP
jgi:hypothetical protein